VSEPVPPLARLFAMAFRQLIDDLHDRLAQRGYIDVKRSFGFVLLAARDAPTSVGDVAALMGMTKQAASKLIDAMVAAGYVDRRSGAVDGRQRPVFLTRRGRSLLAAVEEIYVELEGEWAASIGQSNVDRLRIDITRAVTMRGKGQLPPVRPTW
jgi:DNA-binding MarR family transcriptional regulator